MNKILAVGFCLVSISLAVFFLFKNQERFSGEPGVYVSMDGSSIFQHSCSRCHGKRGEGVPNLTPSLLGRKFSLAQVKKQIQKGGLKMPALPFIQGKALDRLARYVMGLR